MPKEMRCPECGKKMRNKRYPTAFGSYRANSSKMPGGRWGFKYICTNHKCSNYGKEFDYWEIEE